ncbi:MAG: hypothetical protein JJE10_08645 [Thermoleophilia bacterium]|nr:hypothetical protein [Thermoleophilia bacterium]
MTTASKRWFSLSRASAVRAVQSDRSALIPDFRSVNSQVTSPSNSVTFRSQAFRWLG